MNDRGLRLYGIGTVGRSGNTGVLLWGLLASASWLGVLAGYFVGGERGPSLLAVAVVVTLAFGIVYRGYRRTRLNC